MGELAVARRAQFPPERLGFHGNNKTTAEIREALTYGVGRVVVDSFHEIDRIAAVATELGVVAPVMVRVTVGVEAHTHEFIATGHEDQKFGFSLAGGQALEAATRLLARPDVFDLRGLHSHIGSQIFDTGGFEMAARRLVGLHAQIVDEHGHHCPEIDRLNRLCVERGVTQRVLVRSTVGVEAHTHEFIATAHEDQKFGFSLV